MKKDVLVLLFDGSIIESQRSAVRETLMCCTQVIVSVFRREDERLQPIRGLCRFFCTLQMLVSASFTQQLQQQVHQLYKLNSTVMNLLPLLCLCGLSSV